MSPPQRFRFQPPRRPPGSSSIRFVDLPLLSGGQNRARSPSILRKDQSVLLSNFRVEDNYLRPRGDFLRWSVGTLPDTDNCFGVITKEESGMSFDVAYSDATFYWSIRSTWPGSSSMWTSAVISGSPVLSLTTSGDMEDRAISWGVGASGKAEHNMLVTGSQLSFSRLYWSGTSVVLNDITSIGAAPAWQIGEAFHFTAVFKDRGILFSLSDINSNQERYVVAWSASGNVGDWAIANGAGQQNVAEMTGRPTGIIAEVDRLLLFTDKQVWEARPRLDDFVFDFQIISQNVGMPLPYCANSTPLGTFFVGPNYQPYLIRGTSISPVGQSLSEFLRESRRFDDYQTPSQLQTAFIPGDDIWVVGQGTPGSSDNLMNEFAYCFLNRLQEPDLPGAMPEFPWSRMVPAFGTWNFTRVSYGPTNRGTVFTNPVQPNREQQMSFSRPVMSASSNVILAEDGGAYSAEYGDYTFSGTTVPVVAIYLSPELVASRDINSFDAITEFAVETSIVPTQIDDTIFGPTVHTVQVALQRNVDSIVLSNLTMPAVSTLGATSTAVFPVPPIAVRNPKFALAFSGTNLIALRLNRIQLGLRPWSGRGPYG